MDFIKGLPYINFSKDFGAANIGKGIINKQN